MDGVNAFELPAVLERAKKELEVLQHALHATRLAEHAYDTLHGRMAKLDEKEVVGEQVCVWGKVNVSCWCVCLAVHSTRSVCVCDFSLLCLVALNTHTHTLTHTYTLAYPHTHSSYVLFESKVEVSHGAAFMFLFLFVLHCRLHGGS